MYGLNDYFASSWENDFNFHLIHGLDNLNRVGHNHFKSTQCSHKSYYLTVMFSNICNIRPAFSVPY